LLVKLLGLINWTKNKQKMSQSSTELAHLRLELPNILGDTEACVPSLVLESVNRITKNPLWHIID
jgi:hypothetical protein